jgi:hypothetical protein
VPAALPEQHVYNTDLNSLAFVFAAGLLLGVVVIGMRKCSVGWIVTSALSLLLGFGGALAGAILLRLDPTVFSCLGATAGLWLATHLMRQCPTPVSYRRSALKFGSLFAILAGLISFTFAESYVSTTRLRMVTSSSARDLRPSLHDAMDQVFSYNHLAEMIQRPSLNLYRAQRDHGPLDPVVDAMRRDIHILSSGGAPLEFSVSFRYTDPRKAQAVVREFVTDFMLLNANFGGYVDRGEILPGGITFEFISPATYRRTAVSPNRLYFIGGGLAAGALLGLIVAFIRRGPPGRLVPHSAAA